MEIPRRLDRKTDPKPLNTVISIVKEYNNRKKE